MKNYNCTFGTFETKKVNGAYVSRLSEGVINYLIRDFNRSYVVNEITMQQLYKHFSYAFDNMGRLDKEQFLSYVVPIIEKRIKITGRKFKGLKSFNA